MRFALISLLVLTGITGCRTETKTATTKSTETSAAVVPAPSPFLTDTKQFTFDGRRAGEGYFRKDGRYFIFQSERDTQNPFYQIYLRDMKTGQTRRVSPGGGKTTCAWIHPVKEKVIFSSTHTDPKLTEKVAAEWAERKAPKSRYNWSFDEVYDIFEADFNGKNLKNLTHAPGYDAESSYSPDGQWIAFASNRAGYTETLTEADKAAFEKDPSYMMDIYLMRADGSQVKRLTNTRGYDGGPFFSPDGKRITFRRFSPDGRSAEVYTIGVDGQDERRITKLNAMSWAPFYHPSGDYLIFASSVFGHHNFELFIVDVNGDKPPVRVTNQEGFDGLPVFSPSGRELYWTHSNPGGEGQIYVAKWNDTEARRVLGLPAARPETLQPAISAADAMTWIRYLTQDKFNGRMTGAAPEAEYSAELAKTFQSMGLKPAFGEGFEQKFDFISGIELGPGNSLALTFKGESLALKIEKDYVPLSDSKVGEFGSAPVVFAGYGLNAPAEGTRTAYNSYAGLDVKDKWVLVFSGIPNDVSQEQRFHLNVYSKIVHKALVARQNGARGLLVIEDGLAPSAPMKLKYEGRAVDSGLPILRLSSSVADQIFTAAGTTREEWTKKLGTGAVENLLFSNVSAEAKVDLKFTNAPARNVIAVLKVPGATSTVLIGAHMDHLGLGDRGTSLAKEPGIHYGADDNASGVAGVMEIAHDLSTRVNAGQVRLKQNVMFALWSGEEVGILGSNHFVKTNKNWKLSAYLNMDMIGRLRDRLVVQGVASAKEWRGIFERSSEQTPLALTLQDDPFVPSDALTFYLAKTPSLSFFTGAHQEYHTPFDRPELINADGVAQIASIVENTAINVAQGTPLTYVQVEGRAQPTGEGSRGFRLYLGTIPNYSEEVKNGVQISGTSKDSPADKAGLQNGDVIVELGGIKIKTLSDYAYCLQALKANEPTKMRVVRAGKEVELDITPALK